MNESQRLNTKINQAKSYSLQQIKWTFKVCPFYILQLILMRKNSARIVHFIFKYFILLWFKKKVVKALSR